MGLYNWRNKLLLDLPMRAADHDPVNTLTVNRGRAGSTLDGVFGAGAATPTKLGYRRGYSFDGGDYIQCSAGYQLTTARLCVLCTFSGFGAGVAGTLFSWETVGGDSVCRIASDGTNLRCYIGGNAGANSAIAVVANYSLALGVINTVAGQYDGTNTSIWIGGQFVANAATPLAPAATSNAMWIGARTSGATLYTGNIYHAGMADFALSPSQVAQYHREMMQQYHQV